MSDQAEETPDTILADILNRPAPTAGAIGTYEAAPAADQAPAPQVAAVTESKPSEAQVAFARIAELDARIAAMAKAQAAPAVPVPAAKSKRTSITAEDMLYDPNAALEDLGINPEVLAQFMVAKHAGPNAPVDFRVQAALMPRLGALRQEAQESVSALQRRLDEYEAREADRTLAESTQKALSGISAETHPTLTRALAADRDGTLADLLKAARDARKDASGTPESSIAEALSQTEAIYASLAKRLGLSAPATSKQGSAPQPASTSRSAPPATMANLSGTPPARPTGVSHDEELARIKAEILSRTAG